MAVVNKGQNNRRQYTEINISERQTNIKTT